MARTVTIIGRHQEVTDKPPSNMRKPPVMATEIAIRVISTATASSAVAHFGSPLARCDGLCIGRYFSLPNARSSMRMRAIISRPNPIVATMPVSGAQTIAATLTISPTTAR